MSKFLTTNVPKAKPTTAMLNEDQVAFNTFDGKAYVNTGTEIKQIGGSSVANTTIPKSTTQSFDAFSPVAFDTGSAKLVADTGIDFHAAISSSFFCGAPSVETTVTRPFKLSDGNYIFFSSFQVSTVAANVSTYDGERYKVAGRKNVPSQNAWISAIEIAPDTFIVSSSGSSTYNPNLSNTLVFYGFKYDPSNSGGEFTSNMVYISRPHYNARYFEQSIPTSADTIFHISPNQEQNNSRISFIKFDVGSNQISSTHTEIITKQQHNITDTVNYRSMSNLELVNIATKVSGNKIIVPKNTLMTSANPPYVIEYNPDGSWKSTGDATLSGSSVGTHSLTFDNQNDKLVTAQNSSTLWIGDWNPSTNTITSSGGITTGDGRFGYGSGISKMLFLNDMFGAIYRDAE